MSGDKLTPLRQGTNVATAVARAADFREPEAAEADHQLHAAPLLSAALREAAAPPVVTAPAPHEPLGEGHLTTWAGVVVPTHEQPPSPPPPGVPPADVAERPHPGTGSSRIGALPHAVADPRGYADGGARHSPDAPEAGLPVAPAAVCALLVTREEVVGPLARVEAALQEHAAACGAAPASCLAGALVRLERDGRHDLCRVESAALAPAMPAAAVPALSLRVALPPVRTVPTASIAKHHPFATPELGPAEREELACLTSRLAEAPGRGLPLLKAAAAAWRLQVARAWAPALDPLLAHPRGGAAKLAADLACPHRILAKAVALLAATQQQLPEQLHAAQAASVDAPGSGAAPVPAPAAPAGMPSLPASAVATGTPPAGSAGGQAAVAARVPYPRPSQAAELRARLARRPLARAWLPAALIGAAESVRGGAAASVARLPHGRSREAALAALRGAAEAAVPSSARCAALKRAVLHELLECLRPGAVPGEWVQPPVGFPQVGVIAHELAKQDWRYGAAYKSYLKAPVRALLTELESIGLVETQLPKPGRDEAQGDCQYALHT
eukprot:scaffold2.g7087.t1